MKWNDGTHRKRMRRQPSPSDLSGDREREIIRLSTDMSMPVNFEVFFVCPLSLYSIVLHIYIYSILCLFHRRFRALVRLPLPSKFITDRFLLLCSSLLLTPFISYGCLFAYLFFFHSLCMWTICNTCRASATNGLINGTNTETNTSEK